MAEQVCVIKRHIGKRRDARFTRFMIDLDEYAAELTEAEKEGRDCLYVRDESVDAPSFDGLDKAGQKAELARQAARAKLNELADAEAAE